MNILQENLIKAYLREVDDRLCIKLEVCESIDSTNSYVLSRPDEANEIFHACVANHQSNGRGRSGNVWQSPAGSNIYMSLGFHYPVESLSTISGLSLACGVALARFLESLGIRSELKWPNDILVGYKKLAGILIETRVKSSTVFVVVGVGLNVDMENTADVEIDQPWTDLKRSLAAGVVLMDRNLLVANLLSSIVAACKSYLQTGFKSFEDDWIKYDVLIGKQAWVSNAQGKQLVTVLGINKDCSLKVEIDGREKDLYAADVKIKMKH